MGRENLFYPCIIITFAVEVDAEYPMGRWSCRRSSRPFCTTPVLAPVMGCSRVRSVAEKSICFRKTEEGGRF